MRGSNAGIGAGASLYRIRVLPGNALKSTMTSARSAGPSMSPWLETFSTVMLLRLYSKPTGVGGITATLGSNPPSVLIW